MRRTQTRAHRAGSLTLVGVLACALVIFMPYGPAQALDPGDYSSYIVNAPSSMLAGSPGAAATAADRQASAALNAASRDFYKTNPAPGVAVKSAGTLSKVGTVAKGVGTVSGVALGVGVVYNSIGWLNEHADWMLIPEGVGGTGDIECDLATIFGAGNGCELGPAEGYVPNSDVGVVYPGLEGPASIAFVNTVAQGTVAFQIIAAPLYGTNGVATIEYVVSGTCRASGYPGANSGLYGYGGLLVSTGAHADVQGTTGGVFPVDGVYCGSVGQTFSVGGTRSVNVVTNFGSGSGSAKAMYVAIGMSPTSSADAVFLGSSYYGSRYWLEGTEQHEQFGVESDPVRRWVTTYRCVGAPDQVQTSDPWREADPEWPSPPAPACSQGLLEYIRVEQMTEGMDSVLIYEWSSPDSSKTWAATYPECTDGSCLLELWRVAEGTQLACFSNPSLCLDWYTTGQLENYRCTYGGTQIDIQECKVYATVFTGTPTLADPATGERVTTGTAPAPTPVETPGYNTDCPPAFSWTSLFNPWWYYKGVSCALSEAFVPTRAGVQIQRVQQGLSTKAPFSVIVAVPTAVSGFSQGWNGSCDAMPNFSPIEGKPLRMPCSPPASSGWNAGRQLMQIAIYAAVVFGLWRMAHHAVGGRE